MTGGFGIELNRMTLLLQMGILIRIFDGENHLFNQLTLNTASQKIGHLGQRFHNTVVRNLSYPGITPSTVFERSTWFYWTVIAFFYVTFMTLLGVYLELGFYFLLYGFGLMGNFILESCLTFISRKRFNWHVLYSQSFVILSSFAIMLHLGGISNSFGLLITGLTVILSIVIFEKVSWVVYLTILYIVSTIILAVAHPWLSPPEWFTPRVNNIYFLINSCMLTVYTTVLVITYSKNKSRSHRAELLRMKELDDAKTRLFTNITHEFRTPLTVIQGMTDQIRASPEEWLEKGTDKIKQNSQSLLNLVNQMLDLSKLEAGAMPVNMVHGDVVIYLKTVVESFHALAADKGIDLAFKPLAKEINMDYDPDKLLSIASNLITNALKYTDGGQKVEITCSEDRENRMFSLTVMDEGHGIPAAKLPHIYDRFFRATAAGADPSGGTGLGLALTRELIRLLGGRINADSSPGQGTTFRVELPITGNATKHEDVPAQESTHRSVKTEIPQEDQGQDEIIEDAGPVGHPVVLIVEDNRDVTEYLSSLLQPEFDVLVTGNGLEGFRAAVEMVPDVIVSDVMMPVMDGFEMLEKVKSDFRTSHIPVILLTAKVDFASRIEGLDRGADAYIAKPFHKEELFVTIRSLIQLRKKLQERYARPEFPAPSSDRLFQAEDSFMSRIREVMNLHLSDENFGIRELCLALAMSRTQLYRKFSILSNKSVGQYLRSMRLYRAREILEAGAMNVTQTAFEVGYKDLSHFSKSFKEEFGISPKNINTGMSPARPD